MAPKVQHFTAAEVAEAKQKAAERAELLKRSAAGLGALGGQVIAAVTGSNPRVGRLLGLAAARIAVDPKGAAEAARSLVERARAVAPEAAKLMGVRFAEAAQEELKKKQRRK